MFRLAGNKARTCEKVNNLPHFKEILKFQLHNCGFFEMEVYNNLQLLHKLILNALPILSILT